MSLMTLPALAADLEEGRISARALVEMALERAHVAGEAAGPVFLSLDADGARGEADHMDWLRARGRHPSPMSGIPISVKDLFDLAGEVTRAGSVVLDDAPPAVRDAPAISRLKAAGMIVLGRTNMTEFAYSGIGLNPHYGTPTSTWDRESGRIPGGSSAGAGVAVAEGAGAAGIGTDTGGSCRIPAAFNGIVGYKSSFGRIPVDGTYPLSPSLDCIGPLAPDVASCAILDSLMAEDWDGWVVAREPGSLRLAVLNTIALDGLEQPVAHAFDAVLAALADSGAVIVDVVLPDLAELPRLNASGGLSAAEAYAHHKTMIEDEAERYDPRVARRILSGRMLGAADLVTIHKARAALIAAMARLLRGFDAVIMPTVPIVAPPIAAITSDEEYVRINMLCLRNTFIANFCDLCAISVPMHEPGTAPVGLMLCAPHGDDEALFSAAYAVESLIAGWQ